MAPNKREFIYSYEDFAKVCGMTPDAMRTACSPSRNQVNPENLESVMLYCFVNGNDAFRLKVLKSMIRSEDTAFSTPKPERVKKPAKRKVRKPRE